MPRGELGKRGQQQNLQDFGNDFGIHRNRGNAPVNVDKAFDNPLAVISSHGAGKYQSRPKMEPELSRSKSTSISNFS